MKGRNSAVLVAASVIAALSISAACGGGGGGGSVSGTPTPTPTPDATSPVPTPDPTQPPGGSFLPTRIGNVWHYDITAPGIQVVTKTVTVAAYEDIGGAKAGTLGYRFDTALSTSATQKEWQVDEGSTILRERAEKFDATGTLKSDSVYLPDKIYVDETTAHTISNASWTESYDDTTTSTTTGTTTTHHVITWTVLSTNDSVVTSAGTFPCLEVHRVSNQVATSGSDKIYWFSQGVGKVQEEDYNPANPSGTPTQTEQLTSYTLVP